MIILNFIQNFLNAFKEAIRRILYRAKLQNKYPQCRFYNNVSVDNQSVLGKYNVLFNDVTIINSKIGDHTYIQKNSVICDTTIGKFCSIATGTSIGLPQHSTSAVSSHPAFYLKNTPLVKTYCDRDLIETSSLTTIGHDVWIGQNAIIMNGLTIGTGAVIGAGSVVTKDVAPYAIVGGVPAKIIRYRFDEMTRNRLLASEWWIRTEDWLEINYQRFLDPGHFLEGENK